MCLPLRGPLSGLRLFMGQPGACLGWQLPAECPFPPHLLLPLPPGWLHSRQYTLLFPNGLRLAKVEHVWACACTHVRTHTRAGMFHLSQGQLTLVPWSHSAPVQVTAYLGTEADGPGWGLQGLGLGWVQGVLHSGSFIYEGWVHLQSNGLASSPCPACPLSSTEGVCRAPGM